MRTEQIHRTVSDDGTPIVGRVEGSGPPLVLVHGAVADGESEWGELVPLLSDRFTCYLPSMRGRGRSGSHPDTSREAEVRDVTAFVESIGGPVALVGVSGGGMVSLGAAARTSALTAVVAIEPVAFEVMDGQVRARFEEVVASVARALAEDRALEGAGAFLEFAANDEEVAALSEADEGMDELVAYLPLDLEQFRDALAFAGPSPTAAGVLASIDAPTLVLHGTDTASAWFTDSARYAAEHIPDATLHAIPGAGHFGHLVHAKRYAAEMVRFL
jgi:pimeloyl-ACP methyl ester carboxylesterase